MEVKSATTLVIVGFAPGVTVTEKVTVVLGQDEACCRRPLALAPGEELASRLVREGETLRYHVVDRAPERHPRWLQPFWEFPAFWPYWVYFDLDVPPLY